MAECRRCATCPHSELDHLVLRCTLLANDPLNPGIYLCPENGVCRVRPEILARYENEILNKEKGNG